MGLVIRYLFLKVVGCLEHCTGRAAIQETDTVAAGDNAGLDVSVEPPPLVWRHTITLLEHLVEKTQMSIAAVVGDIHDFVVGLPEELHGFLKAQFNLLVTKRVAIMLSK